MMARKVGWSNIKVFLGAKCAPEASGSHVSRTFKPPAQELAATEVYGIQALVKAVNIN